jgi:antirestriction protein ArdC
MKIVNGKLYATIDKLIKTLTKVQNALKEDIKDGAKITFEDYAKIKVVYKTRYAYSKEDQKALEEYAKKQGFVKIATNYEAVEIDNINDEVNDKVDQIMSLLELANDNTITKVASKVATIVR